jgi:hypothetical protein
VDILGALIDLLAGRPIAAALADFAGLLVADFFGALFGLFFADFFFAAIADSLAARLPVCRLGWLTSCAARFAD